MVRWPRCTDFINLFLFLPSCFVVASAIFLLLYLLLLLFSHWLSPFFFLLFLSFVLLVCFWLVSSALAAPKFGPSIDREGMKLKWGADYEKTEKLALQLFKRLDTNRLKKEETQDLLPLCFFSDGLLNREEFARSLGMLSGSAKPTFYSLSNFLFDVQFFFTPWYLLTPRFFHIFTRRLIPIKMGVSI